MGLNAIEAQADALRLLDTLPDKIVLKL